MSASLPSEIAAALQSGATVLTANQRAARSLRRLFDQTMQAEGRTLWSPAAILPLETWLASLWRQLLLDGSQSRMLLNRPQEHAIWRGILAADSQVSALRSLDSLAELAASSWRTLCLYQGRTRLREFTHSADTRAFVRWADEFDRVRNRNLYLTSAQLPAALEHALAQGTLPLPAAGLALVDFDLLPPAHAQLFDAIRQAGYSAEQVQTSVASQSAQLFSATDDLDELRTAALWTRQRLDRNPTARVAIVVPALADKRAALTRIFGEILAPELQPITALPAPPPYDFSLGQPLADLPMVAAAFDLLRWPAQPLPLESISALLVSPFFAAAEPNEVNAAAEFDAYELRRAHLLRPELPLDALIALVEASPRRARLISLLHRLRSLRKAAAASHLLPSESAQQSHAAWAEAFTTLLDAAGWTAAATRDSLSFQAHRRWESALDELATLDFNGARATAAVALAALQRLARQTIFAPESGDAPVQIVGPLELGGVPFDALWFLGADDLTWPPAPASRPLLPWALQRALGMPGADAVRDSAHARRLTERVAHSAPELVFSFARHAEEGERRVSSALAPLSLAELTHKNPVSQPQPQRFDEHPDADPLPALPDQVIHGGAQILQLQAACAFRAFAEKRLFSTELDTREPGLDARDRGNVVHTVMQRFWDQVEGQQALRALAPDQRHALLDACIELALDQAERASRSPWDASYLNVQRLRLRALLRPWLEVELARPSFTVRAREQDAPAIALGPLQLNLRVDRIDQTGSGILILDYKTGEAKPSEWLSDRPDAPQLPLYAVLSQQPNEEVAGVAFALLRAGKDMGLTGFADHPGVFGKLSRMTAPSLAEQIDEWRIVLTNLAEAFAAGDTRVLPKSYPHTCKHCAQRILCRLDVASLEDLGDDEDDGPGDFSEASFEERTRG